jgi:UDPglucose 6-dehydrogenase
MGQARRLVHNVEFAANAYEAAERADAVVLVTEWDAFRALDLDRLKSTLNSPVLVDLRNAYRADELKKHGFTYTSIGQPSYSGFGEPADSPLNAYAA